MSNAVAIYCTKCSVQLSMCYDDYPEYRVNDMFLILCDAWNCRVHTPNYLIARNRFLLSRY